MNEKDIVYHEANQYQRASLTVYHPEAKDLKDFIKKCIENKRLIEILLEVEENKTEHKITEDMLQEMADEIDEEFPEDEENDS